MALNPTDKATLDAFLLGHGVYSHYSDNSDILTWILANPSPFADDSGKNFELVIAAMTYQDKSNLFALRDVPQWYSGVWQKIDNGTDTIVSYLGANDSERRKNLKVNADLFVKDLVLMTTFDYDMQRLLNRLINTNPSGLGRLMSLLVADDVFSEMTVLRINAELNIFNPRWQTIGLTQAPELSDLPSFP